MLVELDTRQERAQLAAAEAQRDLARTNFDRMQGLLKDNVISRAEYDSATADDKQTEARVGEIRAAIQRKRITAPFSGILGIRQVNVGQYLSSGDPIVQLQSLNPIYVNFDVPQQATAQMRTGRDVRITTGDVAGVEFHGTHHGHRLGRERRDAQHSGAGDARRIPDGAAAARHVRAGRGRPRRRPLGDCASGDGHQLRAVRRFGVRRRRI